MTKILIGFILLFFDFEFNGFDILSDFVGYIFIFLGCHQLTCKSKNFHNAKWWTAGLLVYILIKNIIELSIGYYDSEFIIVLDILVVFVSIYIDYFIVAGVKDLEKAENAELNSKKLMILWGIQSVSIIISSLCTFWIENIVVEDISIVLLVIALLVHIGFLVNFYTAKRLYDKINKNDDKINKIDDKICENNNYN